MFPATFISSAFVPVESMPAALESFAKVNPFTTFFRRRDARPLGRRRPAGNAVWGAFVWSPAIIAVFAPLAVSRTGGRRAGSRGDG